MQKHQAEFMKVVKEYNQQINMLLGMAQTANRRQLSRLTEILNRLKGSLQKLTMQQNEFKRYIANPVKYNALLQPYICCWNRQSRKFKRQVKKREP